MRSFIVVFAVAAGTSFASGAGAEEHASKSRPGWYGLQTLACDGGAVISGLTMESPGLGVAGFALAAPIVHFAHGNVLNGFASLALRIVAPTVLAFAARADGGEANMTWGIVGGAVLASAFDAAFLARVERF